MGILRRTYGWISGHIVSVRNSASCMEPTKRTRILQIAGIAVGTAVLCPILNYLGRNWIPRIWNDPHAINFLAAWIPAVLSILVAFVPDRELEMSRRIAWRVVVISCGVFYSVILWHQQDLSDKAIMKQTQDAIGTAVSKANDHADPQFRSIQSQVADVRENLKTTGEELSAKVDQSTSTINAEVGKVGKPDPPELAKLQFSLWKDGMKEDEWPLNLETVEQKQDGTVEVKFAVKNISNVQAEELEIWVTICDLCQFSSEPEKFDKPRGTPENQRHRLFGNLNANVTMEPSVVRIKFTSAVDANQLSTSPVGIGFISACKNCGKSTPAIPFYFHVVPVTTLPQ